MSLARVFLKGQNIKFWVDFTDKYSANICQSGYKVYLRVVIWMSNNFADGSTLFCAFVGVQPKFTSNNGVAARAFGGTTVRFIRTVVCYTVFVVLLHSINHKCMVHIIYIFYSFRPSACSQLNLYWKELRSCNIAQHFRLLPAQIIGYLL
jgi:hypothetical protein